MYKLNPGILAVKYLKTWIHLIADELYFLKIYKIAFIKKLV